MLPAGDTALRSDIQYLADHGIITGSVSTWPLAWAPIARDVNAADPANLPSHLAEVVRRVRARAEQATRQGQLLFTAEVAGADNPTRVRGFEDTPRGDVDARAGAAWQGGRFSAELNVQYVDPPVNKYIEDSVNVVQDDDEVRVDDSLLAVTLGNWSIGASTQQRWWGPGWDGSLILSNNARPIPSLVIDRVFTDAFETKWLSWIGPWDLTHNVRPARGRAIHPECALLRHALHHAPAAVARDRLLTHGAALRRGPAVRFRHLTGTCSGVTTTSMMTIPIPIPHSGLAINSAASMRAGTRPFGTVRMAFYGQLIGEDEADFFPSRYLGMFGLEWSGYLDNRWSSRFFAEYADATCEFYKSDDGPNCAYRHGRYRTGYRYLGRVIGHPGESDAD